MGACGCLVSGAGTEGYNWLVKEQAIKLVIPDYHGWHAQRTRYAGLCAGYDDSPG